MFKQSLNHKTGMLRGQRLRMLLLTLLISVLATVALTGCKDTTSQDDPQNNLPNSEQSDNAAGQDDEAEGPIESDATEGETAEEASANADHEAIETKDNKFETYISLLGMDEQTLTETLNETPEKTDEGGLAFENEGIRVWFNDNTVSQVFTTSSEIDLDGVVLGDTIDAFKTVFGEPTSDSDGDMHFQYGDVYLSVNYDAATQKTMALYILKEDF
ncbi:hypothetical protein KHM83_06450 [Fusibacter paucivorans]|uniref:DUF4309 domain-containing protein n=1 Tax=Fusibacter paucivorans TaxID=76009 RepID=A0ABS5PPN1_9FIRM|nr:hypothetical protein [Fusibacter paucivorans]MBS7526311.1 hypothetical protein [Fusibacter paucivorans]